MDILKQYDAYLTNNLDELHDDVMCVNPNYRCVDCDWHAYMVDLYKYSIKSFIEHYNIDIQTIMPYRYDFKHTFNNNGCVINVWKCARELMVDSKLCGIDSDFQ